MSNDLVLRQAGLRLVNCIVRERQIRLYGMWRDSLQWIPPIERIGPCQRPHAWVVVASCEVLSEDTTGLASAWAMARRRSKEYLKGGRLHALLLRMFAPTTLANAHILFHSTAFFLTGIRFQYNCQSLSCTIPPIRLSHYNSRIGTGLRIRLCSVSLY